jgi:hypothetical protein
MATHAVTSSIRSDRSCPPADLSNETAGTRDRTSAVRASARGINAAPCAWAARFPPFHTLWPPVQAVPVSSGALASRGHARSRWTTTGGRTGQIIFTIPSRSIRNTNKFVVLSLLVPRRWFSHWRTRQRLLFVVPFRQRSRHSVGTVAPHSSPARPVLAPIDPKATSRPSRPRCTRVSCVCVFIRTAAPLSANSARSFASPDAPIQSDGPQRHRNRLRPLVTG